MQVTTNLFLALQIISGAKHLLVIKHTGSFLRDWCLWQTDKSRLHCFTYLQTEVVNKEETKCCGHHRDKACLQLYFVPVTFLNACSLCTCLLNRYLFKRYKALNIVQITNYSLAPAESCHFPLRRGAGTGTDEPELVHHNHQSEAHVCNRVPHITQVSQTFIKFLPCFLINEFPYLSVKHSSTNPSLALCEFVSLPWLFPCGSAPPHPACAGGSQRPP